MQKDVSLHLKNRNTFAWLHGQKYTISRVKTQMANYKKIFAVDIRNEGLISLIKNF